LGQILARVADGDDTVCACGNTETTRLGRRAGVLGASTLAASHALSPAGMAGLLRAHGLADG
jgi:hypothetical protein